MWQRLRRKLLFSRTNRRLISWAQRHAPWGFAGFSLFAISRFFFRALTEGQLITRASAISFKLFLAFFPGVIMLLTLIPFIPIANFQEKLLGTFMDLLPWEVYTFIEGQLHDLLVKKHATLLSVSSITGLYFASNSMDAILAGFSGSSNLSTWHSPVKQRILSLVLMLLFVILRVVAIAVLTLSSAAIGWLNDEGLVTGGLETFGLLVVKWAVPLLLLLTGIAMLYSAGDPMRTRFRLLSPGSVLATLLVVIVAKALALIFGRFTDYNALYGSIGAILAVQLWIYLNMIALLVGFELNTSIAKAHIDRSDRLRMQPERTPVQAAGGHHG
ncbi:MAG: YihY/virulence factor BrkB family protein [Flavobacteriales bacterium]